MKTFRNISIIVITILAAAVFVRVLLHAVVYSSSSDLTVPQGGPGTVVPSADMPVSLSIPALGIHAKIQEVGVTSDGKMAVPDNFTDVGWYKYGALPGQKGSAVIAGHVDDGLSFPGVFVNLDKLKVGDDIYVVTEDNQALHFVMTGSKSYDRDANTSDIFNDTSGTMLRLITCTGTWLPDLRTHDQRLVVTAVLK